jgi:energy-coupling factor transporter ATP-binding protein EcfA2
LVPDGLTRDEIIAPEDSLEANRLHRLFSLSEVNALPTGTELQFEPDGLTIVYGKNGSGKSSYVRALKRLCRSVDRDQTILPNVLKQATKGARPRAHIEWVSAKDGTITGQEFGLAELDLRTPIDSMSVFDSRCAHIYVDDENQIAFVPNVVQILVRLAEEQMALRREVEELLTTSRARRPDFSTIAVGSTARKAVDALTRASNVEDIKALATLSDAEVEKRKQLELALATAASGASQRQQAELRAQARGASELLDRLESAKMLLAPERVTALRDAAGEAKRMRELARIAAEEAFAGEDLPGVGGDPWKELWEAARRFYGAPERSVGYAAASDFPNTEEGADCPLCFQELDETARARFRRFEKFIKSDAEARGLESERKLAQEQDRLSAQPLDACKTPFLESLAETNRDIHSKLEEWLAQAEQYREALRAASSGDAPWPSGPLPDLPVIYLRAFAESRNQEADVVALAVKADQREKFEAKLAELKAREALSECVDDAGRWITELGEIAALDSSKSELSTQSISLKQKALTEQVVTAALKNQLREELDTLGFTHIIFELKPRGVHGTTMVQLRLRDAPERQLAEILSEGEKRALALAFFLAEIATAEHAGGIILDDPVSSLDQERRQVIAKRIVAETSARQVILFTHDIAFLFHVQVESEAHGGTPKVQQVWRVADSVGLTAADAPFEATRVKERSRWLANKLQEMPKEREFKNPDEHRMHVASWYDHLRRSWERAVEEVVFNEAVQRFVPQIQTQRLKKISVTQSMLDEVEAGMTVCSRWVHDQPVEEGGALPDRSQMRHDLDAFTEFCKKHRPS